MVAGRAKVCNVCHDIFFIVVFDDGGLVVNLAPIIITKYKNVEFDANDVAFLKSRVVGRLLSREIVFDPTVDAVSTATMSSALVFDTLRRLRETWAGMVKAGWRDLDDRIRFSRHPADRDGSLTLIRSYTCKYPSELDYLP